MRTSRVSQFINNKRGNVAVIWAFALLPILAVVGLAVDTQIAFSKKDRVQYAADSAVLAGARMLQSSNSESEALAHAQTYFNSLVANQPGLTCGALQIGYPGDDEIGGSVTCQQATTLSHIIGWNELELNISSTAIYGVGKLDVAFVFDISGSMNSHGRISDLKDAAEDAVTTLLPAPGSSSEGDVRIAMVAYNSMIDAGNFFEEVTGMTKNRTYRATYTEDEEVCEWRCRFAIGSFCLSWREQCEWVEREYTSTKTVNSSCVYERDGSYKFGERQPTQRNTPDLVSTLQSGQRRATTDPNNADGFLSTAYAVFNESDKSWNVIGEDCSSVRPFELSHNHTQIDLYINSLYANGGTAGHQGIAWGWYLISPEWDDIFDNAAAPLSYDEPDTTKAMIMMTDGEFLNQLYSSQGSSTDQAKALCDSIKAEDVVIFTIAFQAPDVGEEVLEYCASSGDHAFKASNGAELQASYQSIATSISDLRIKS